MEPILLILADDHQVMRQGLAMLLDAEDDLRVVAQAANGHEALECIEKHAPRVAVVDYSMPGLDGLGVVEEVAGRGLQTAVVILTMHKERGLARRALDRGALAVVLKDDAFEDLARAIRTAADGGRFLSAGFDLDSATGGRADSELTPREREVVCWIARGKNNKEIASELCISVKTVETHRARLLRKLGLHTATEVVRYAVRAGLVEP